MISARFRRTAKSRFTFCAPPDLIFSALGPVRSGFRAFWGCRAGFRRKIRCLVCQSSLPVAPAALHVKTHIAAEPLAQAVFFRSAESASQQTVPLQSSLRSAMISVQFCQYSQNICPCFHSKYHIRKFIVLTPPFRSDFVSFHLVSPGCCGTMPPAFVSGIPFLT